MWPIIMVFIAALFASIKARLAIEILIDIHLLSIEGSIFIVCVVTYREYFHHSNVPPTIDNNILTSLFRTLYLVFEGI